MEEGLFSIEEDGCIKFMGDPVDSEQSHVVNKHVVKSMLNEIFEAHNLDGGDELTYVNLANRCIIEAPPLTPLQNRAKNRIEKRVREKVKGDKDFGESEYMQFSWRKRPYYLKKRTKKLIKKKMDAKALVEESHAPESMADKVLRLEAENSVLRDRRQQVLTPADAFDANPSTKLIPQLPEVVSQQMDVNPAVDAIKLGPRAPLPTSTRDSPSLRYIQALFRSDKYNFNKDLDKKIFGPLFQ